ncbi:MAG: thiazole synthase [Omnitrophica bacterium GWA2_52_12]|nr:MAG: thiazole synthase [Omnitrophica bacterium GWA2_52_12]
MSDTKLKIGKYELNSRLILGTGKYATLELMVKALEVSGSDMITVAIGRVNLDQPGEKNLLDWIDKKRYQILPNTAGAYTAKDAVRIARLGRAAGLGDLVKVEVIGDSKTLMPDTEGLLEATKILVAEGFVVMPYTNDDPIMACKLEQAGAACVMPLASPIGSGRGIQNPLALRFVMEAVSCPVIVDAGVGTASHAAVCMELGADGVLMNTAVAQAQDPVLMAEAMRDGVLAGRKAFLAGRMPEKIYAQASSPQEGLALKS